MLNVRIEAVDCSQRPGPDTGNSDDAGVADDGMDDLMAEILAEEVNEAAKHTLVHMDRCCMNVVALPALDLLRSANSIRKHESVCVG